MANRKSLHSLTRWKLESRDPLYTLIMQVCKCSSRRCKLRINGCAVLRCRRVYEIPTLASHFAFWKYISDWSLTSELRPKGKSTTICIWKTQLLSIPWTENRNSRHFATCDSESLCVCPMNECSFFQNFFRIYYHIVFVLFIRDILHF